jgi:uncharacterized protein YoxC
MSAEMTQALAKIDETRAELTKEFKGLVERFEKELKRAEPSTELTNLSTRMDKEVAPKLAMLDAMEKSIKDTQAAVAEIEKSRQAKGDKASFTSRPGSRPGRSLALEALNSEKAKRWREAGEAGGAGKLTVNVKHIWTPGEIRSARGYGARNLSQKADALTWDGDSVGDGVTPQYREGIIEIAQYLPILRKYIPIMTTTATDSIKTDVEKYDRELAGKLTADKAIGSSSFVLDYVDGWSATPPFNKIILNNGSAFEELTIQSVTAATKTIVTTTPSTIAMVTGDHVYGPAFVPIAESKAAARMYNVIEDKTFDIVKLFASVKITLEKLRDMPGSEDFINRRLLSKLAKNSDLNMLYGPGGTGNMAGFFSNSAVEKLTRTGATTYLDHITDAIYACKLRHYEPDASLCSIPVHKGINQLKGSDGHYIVWRDTATGMPMVLRSIPLESTAALQANHGLVGAFGVGATFYLREDAEVEIGLNGDDFTNDERTVIGRERGTLATHSPAAFEWTVF